MRRNEFITQYAWDSEWFLEIKRIKYPLILQSLQSDESQIRAQFEDFNLGKIISPRFTYSNQSLERNNKAFDELTQLRSQILQYDGEKSIKNLYLDKIDEILLELEIVSSSLEGNWDKFNLCNVKRYGLLEPDLCGDLKHVLSEKKYNTFSYVDFAENNRIVIEQAECLNDEFDRSIEIIKPLEIELNIDSLHTANEVQAIFNRELHKIDTGWKAVIKSDVTYMKVDSRKREVVIPSRISIGSNRLRDLLAHEIGVHVRRRVSGRKSRLQLLSIGLPGYESAEEGLAMYTEQILNRRKNYGGQDKYLALMVATGELDGQPKTFAETYRLLQSYFIERNNALKKNILAEKSQWKAWKITWRIFRGGNPEIPGCCFLKDKIYREGYYKIRRNVKSHPEFFLHLYEGKFDPCNKTHRDIVSKTLLS